MSERGTGSARTEGGSGNTLGTPAQNASHLWQRDRYNPRLLSRRKIGVATILVGVLGIALTAFLLSVCGQASGLLWGLSV